MDVADRVGMSQEDLPLFYDMAASMPSTAHTTAWNMGRVSNTIVGGGTRLGRNGGRGGIIRQGVPQTFGPGHFRRLSRAANIDSADSSMYSPFGALSKSGNLLARKASQNRTGRRALIRAAGGKYDPTADAFARGSFGRMAAVARINAMNPAKFNRNAGNIFGAIRDMDPEVLRNTNPIRRSLRIRERAGAGVQSRIGGRFGPMGISGTDAAIGQRAAAVGGLTATNGGYISGRVGGYFAGAQEARMAAATGSKIGLETLTEAVSGNKFASRGVAAGIKGFGAEGAAGLMGRFAGSKGLALGLRAAGPIGWIMLARDLGKMAGKVVSHTAKTFMEAGSELMRPLNGAPLSGTFKDNAVAATSRQRGVAAIANSRLNMRSMLGNEAAMMAAHFG